MKVYKVKEVADILQIHFNTVKSEINKGRLHGVKVGSEWRITETALAEYLDVIANDYKTENEVKLEKENIQLKSEIDKYKNIVYGINSMLIKANENEKKIGGMSYGQSYTI